MKSSGLSEHIGMTFIVIGWKTASETGEYETMFWQN